MFNDKTFFGLAMIHRAAHFVLRASQQHRVVRLAQFRLVQIGAGDDHSGTFRVIHTCTHFKTL